MNKASTDPTIVNELLTRGVEEVIDSNHLKERLLAGQQLRIKFGIDPTAPDLHLGHAVPLRKLRQFQEAGHKVILIIGDFTAMIGDPSGRTTLRKPLEQKEIKKNLKDYLIQASKIIDLNKTEVVYNSKWFASKKGLNKILELSRISTVQQVLHRADFQKRIKENSEITLLETLYPIFQGYDSVEISADVEIGGTDQKFNLLMGRQIQRYYKKTEQDILTLPILEGLDGVKKMSKSYDNYIGLSDSPNDMFGKTMSLPDSLVEKYFKLCTDLKEEEINEIKKGNPRDGKIKLGFEIVKTYHNERSAEEARENFIKIFQKKEIPENIPEVKIKNGEELVEVLIKNNFVKSKGEFKKLVDEGAITDLLENKKVTDYHAQIIKDSILRIGKHRFIKTVF